jgi:hypothetical protein
MQKQLAISLPAELMQVPALAPSSVTGYRAIDFSIERTNARSGARTLNMRDMFALVCVPVGAGSKTTVSRARKSDHCNRDANANQSDAGHRRILEY